MRISAFPDNGRFYKGNLHAHTTLSDGRNSPAALMKIYRAHGYDFCAITDHNVYGYHRDQCDENFIVLPGIETHIERFGYKGCHVVGIGRDDETNGFDEGERMINPVATGPETIQRIVDRLLERGNIAIHAHPRWSLLDFSDCMAFSGHIAMEVQNSGAHVENNTGYADNYYDFMLNSGRKLYCVAADDTHQKKPWDYCRSWICAKAPRLSVNSIFDAITAGHFYASEGPEIKDFYVEDGKVFVECSPCRDIHFMSYPYRGRSYAGDGTLKTEASWELKPDCNFIRAVCVDTAGRKAWTNPIWLKEENN